MTEKDKSSVDKKVPCDVCLKEIPASLAMVAEAEDYVQYFCGLECFEKWEEQAKKPKE